MEISIEEAKTILGMYGAADAGGFGATGDRKLCERIFEELPELKKEYSLIFELMELDES